MKKTLLLRSAIVWNRFLTEGKGQNETTSNEATPAKVADCGNFIVSLCENPAQLASYQTLSGTMPGTDTDLMEKLLLNISIQTFINLQNKKTIATCSTTASCIILFRPVLTEQQQVQQQALPCQQPILS
ncbi:24_t:CDS:2 [Rhizophagus irregularis]|nr:24_t:CDS:2 [Rhizophagus irregularis]